MIARQAHIVATVVVAIALASLVRDAARAQPSPAAVPSPALAPSPGPCDVRVFDVSPDVAGGVVRFVLGGKAFGGGSADVEFVTSRTLYGVTISGLKIAMLGNATTYDLSQPYAATLPDASTLKGVYVSTYVDSTGAKHTCDPSDGLPLEALPYVTSLPHSTRIEAATAMRSGTEPSPLPAVAFVNYDHHYNCDVPFQRGGLAGRAALPEFPSGRVATKGGEVLVLVSLDAAGKILDTSIASSSGDGYLDTLAVDAAKRTTYLPRILECTGVPSSYTFKVDFAGE